MTRRTEREVARAIARNARGPKIDLPESWFDDELIVIGSVRLTVVSADDRIEVVNMLALAS